MDPVFPDCFPPLLVMVMYQLLPCLKIFEHLICYQAGEKLLSCDITIIASLHFVSQLHLSILCQNLQSWAFFINISQQCVLQLSSIFFSFRQLKTMHFATLTRVSCEMQSFDLSKKNPAANWGVKMVWHCRNSWQTSLTWRRAQLSWDISPLCVSQLSSITSLLVVICKVWSCLEDSSQVHWGAQTGVALQELLENPFDLKVNSAELGHILTVHFPTEQPFLLVSWETHSFVLSKKNSSCQIKLVWLCQSSWQTTLFCPNPRWLARRFAKVAPYHRNQLNFSTDILGQSF